MNERDVDERLEAHLRRTLQEVARTTPRVITPFRGRQHRSLKSRHAASIAAGALLIVGVAGLFVVTQQASDTTTTGDSIPTASDAIAVEPTTDSLLTSPVAADVQAFVGIDRPVWRMTQGPYEGQGGYDRPSIECPGCGAERLVLVENGVPLLGGAMFTAWALDAVYDLDQLDEPVVVGQVDGRAKVRDDTPTAQMRVMVAWPLAGGRTAFVDAVGLSTAQVVEMAAGLSFDADVPTMATLPAGFRQVDAPPKGVLPSEPVPGASTALLVAYLADDAGRTIQVSGTNQGVHGLLNWAAGFEHLLVNELHPSSIAGTTVAFDEAAWWPAGRFGAYWIAGDWGYRVAAEGFDSRDEFVEVLAHLQLTDTAAAATEETTGMTESENFSYATGWVSEDGTPVTRSPTASTTPAATGSASEGGSSVTASLTASTTPADS